MLLKRLVEYSQRLDLPPVMYLRTPVRWLIDLDSDGRLLGFVPMTSGRKNDRGMEAPDAHDHARLWDQTKASL